MLKPYPCFYPCHGMRNPHLSSGQLRAQPVNDTAALYAKRAPIEITDYFRGYISQISGLQGREPCEGLDAGGPP
jgi:hypothetical protein